MTRTFSILFASLVLAALLGGCDGSSGSGSATGPKSTPRKDVEAGSIKPPGGDITTAAGGSDPTGGKKSKPGEADKKKEGG